MKSKFIVLVVMAALLISTTCYATFAGSEPRARPAFEKMDSSTGEVNVSVLNLREGPSTDYPTIGKLSKGQVLTVMGRLGDWYAVYDPDTGRVGAVYGRYLDVEDVTVPVSANVAEKKEKTSPPSSGKIVLTEDEQKLLELVNKAREENGLEPLAIDENLMKVARIKAKDMVKTITTPVADIYSPFDMMSSSTMQQICRGEHSGQQNR